MLLFNVDSPCVPIVIICEGSEGILELPTLFNSLLLLTAVNLHLTLITDSQGKETVDEM